jgi:predicted phage terminase large subunit-like protein
MSPTAAQLQLRNDGRDELAIRFLWAFMRQAWRLVEPGEDLKWNWHIRLICDELEMITRGVHREVVICIPPRHLKTRCTCVFWQAWWMLHDPSVSTLAITNDVDLATDSSRELRNLIQSEWYRSLVATQHRRGVYDHLPKELQENHIGWGLSKDQAAKANWVNTAGGGRRCLGVGSTILGKGASGLIIDDAYDAREVMRGSVDKIAEKMAQVVKDYDHVWRTRLNDPKRGWRLTIMQRLDPRDLAGVLISRKVEQGRNVRVVVLPTEYDPDFPAELGGIHPRDPRTERGQLLHEAHVGRQEIDEACATPAGIRWFTGMYNQRPSAAAGTKFQREWFERHRYSADPQRMAVDEIALTVDCASSKKKTANYSRIQAWGRKGGATLILLDEAGGQWEFIDLEREFRLMCAKWPRALKKYIEDKSNGAALISRCSVDHPDEDAPAIGGIISINPREDKETRAKYTEAAAEAGNIRVPTMEAARRVRPDHPEWADEWIEEHVAFPAGANDDRVDASSQLIKIWTVDSMPKSLNAGFRWLAAL